MTTGPDTAPKVISFRQLVAFPLHWSEDIKRGE